MFGGGRDFLSHIPVCGCHQKIGCLVSFSASGCDGLQPDCGDKKTDEQRASIHALFLLAELTSCEIGSSCCRVSIAAANAEPTRKKSGAGWAVFSQVLTE
jgi:hypothetical protein